MTDLVSIQNNQVVVSSRQVAEHFEKEHRHVLESIRVILTSAENSAHLFHETTAPDSYGREQKIYLMNRDGFSLLAMGFTGLKALQWKLKYIEAFNEMEDKLKKPALDEDLEARMRIAELIKETDKETRPYILQLFRDYIPEEKKSLERVAHEVNSGTDIVTAFRKMVRDEIENQKTSFRAIAKAAEISHATIGFYLNGKRSPGIAGADQLLKALGLTLVLGKGGEEK